jgi:hypothetical protein
MGLAPLAPDKDAPLAVDESMPESANTLARPKVPNPPPTQRNN